MAQPQPIQRNDEPASPATAPAAAPPAPVTNMPAVKRRRSLIRIPLLGIVPLLIAYGGFQAWLHGGRHVETDNAYVKTDKVMVAPEVSGRVVEVFVHQNDPVQAGDALFRIDDEPFRLALARAEAELSQARTDVESRRLEYRQALGEIELADSQVAFARTQLDRQESLARANIGRDEDLDSARHDFQRATREATVARQHAATLLAALSGDPDIAVEAHPRYREAEVARDQAALDVTRTTVRAPFTGIASNTPNPGDFVQTGQRAMAVIADRDMWVEANYKETQLTYMRPGQKVELHVDTYPQHTWTGTVQSIAEATGAEFALLPPQNATGNWVKVVQRIPVKVVLDPGPEDAPLRAGMSVVAIVDTGHVRHPRDVLPKGW